MVLNGGFTPALLSERLSTPGASLCAHSHSGAPQQSHDSAVHIEGGSSQSVHRAQLKQKLEGQGTSTTGDAQWGVPNVALPPMRSMRLSNEHILITAASQGLVVLKSFSLHQFMAESKPMRKAKIQPGLVPQRFDGCLPRLVVDMYGFILLLYIPDYWDEGAKTYLRLIIQQLRNIAPPVADKRKAHDGRINPADAKLGRVTKSYHWSPAWHATGHHHDPDPAAFGPAKELIEPRRPQILDAKMKFLDQKAPSDDRIAHLLSLAYPQLIVVLKSLKNELCKQPSPICDIMKHWNSPFPAMCIAFDRTTGRHRDKNGCFHGVDVMYPLGDFSGGDFCLPELGITFKWTPGCFAAVDGRTFTHEVMDWSGKERICVIHFIRRFILDHLEVLYPEDQTNVLTSQFFAPHLDLSRFE